MPHYLISISGSVELDAPTREQAMKDALAIDARCTCSAHAREVGVDCDALGWSLNDQHQSLREAGARHD